MNVQWTDQAAACPVVELHDIRTEKFRSDKYLSLVEDRLTGPFLAAGGHALGEFRVENHPDWLLLLRGYSSMPARRRARCGPGMRSANARAHGSSMRMPPKTSMASCSTT